MTYQYKFAQTLKCEFEKRKERNNRYSLRSFAKQLNIDVSILSRIMAGKIHVSDDIILRANRVLAFDSETLMPLIEDALYKHNVYKETFVEGQPIRGFTSDEFDLISNWYHFVILQLSKNKDFVCSPEWICQKINITHTECQLAIERLFSLKLLTEKEGRVVATSDYTSTLSSDKVGEAHRSRQKQVLKYSAIAIDEIVIEKRDHSSVTLSVGENLIPEIKERIKAFRRELATFIEKKSPLPDKVYELNISFFPWSK